MTAVFPSPPPNARPVTAPRWAAGPQASAAEAHEQALLDLLGGRLPASKAIDSEALADLILYHRVHPTVLETLQHSESASPAWAATLQERLLEVRLFETRAWRQKESEGSRIAAAFTKHGIEGLFVKGFALAKRVYSSPADRAFGDIDVWVAPGEWRKAAAALGALGYHPKPLARWTEAIGVAYRKEAAGDDEASEIDLHWAFAGRQGPQRFTHLNLSAIRSRADLVEPGMRLAKVEDELVLSACHLVRSSFCPLSAFVDMRYLAGKKPDWEAVWREAEPCGLRTALRAGLELSGALLGYSLPAGALLPAPWPHWQRALLLPHLAPAKLVRRDRLHQPGARYALKYFCQDSVSRVLATLACLPLDLLRKTAGALSRHGLSTQ